MAKKKTKLILFNEFATREKLEAIKGLMNILPDPDDILAQNNYDYKIYRDLLTDAHLMAAIQQRKMQIMQMDWEIEYDGEERIKIRAKEILNELPIQKIMNDILDCILFGMTIQEIMWKYDSDEIIPYDVVEKPQEWFIFNLDNELLLRKNEGGTYLFEEGEQLPELKFIVNRYHPTYNNPYGEKILSRCYWPVTFKRSGIEFWQTMVERYGMPYLIGYYAIGATTAEQEELLAALEKMVQDNITVMDEKYINKIELKESPSYDIGQLYEILVKFHNSEISKAVLTVTLTTDNQQTGSYKLGEIHKEMLSYIGLTDKKIVQDGINRILEYWTYINWGMIDAPKFILKKKEAIIEESGERDERLHKVGVRFTKEYFKKRYNLEEEDFELTNPPWSPLGKGGNRGKMGQGGNRGDGAKEKNGLVLKQSKKNPLVRRWQKKDRMEK